MGFDLEGHGPAVADVDHAGVLFAGFDEHLRPFGREILKLLSAVLVGAVLGPHHGENAELRISRLPFQDAFQAFVFVRSQAVVGYQFRSDRRIFR